MNIKALKESTLLKIKIANLEYKRVCIEGMVLYSILCVASFVFGILAYLKDHSNFAILGAGIFLFIFRDLISVVTEYLSAKEHERLAINHVNNMPDIISHEPIQTEINDKSIH